MTRRMPERSLAVLVAGPTLAEASRPLRDHLAAAAGAG